MLAAKELSNQPHKAIIDIAMGYGYSTHESFTRAFGQVWNCTPSEFRKKKYVELFPRFRIISERESIIEFRNADISELCGLFKKRNSCFICCDICGVKQINQISRKAGDLAILEAIGRMVKVINGGDVVYRIGGDEFCILTNSRELGYAEEIAHT